MLGNIEVRELAEALVVMSVRPDLVDNQGKVHYEPGDDVMVDINMQYPSPVGHARVIGDGLRMRVQPHIDATQLGSLAEGDQVDVWGSVGEWSLVRKDETFGWSATRFLERV